MIQKLGAGGGVQAKIALFGGGRGVAASAALPTADLLSDWLSIHPAVAQHAYDNRAGFDGFTALPKPSWFQRDTILKEVEDWMRATYKKTYSEMDSFAQAESDAPDALRDNVYLMYRSLPEEHDAHAIEEMVVTNLTARIGHAGHENKRRTDPLFGP